MCYFLIDTYVGSEKDRSSYDAYICRVKPVVEKYGGRYLLRSENITPLSEARTPQRVIIIHFPDQEHLERCFASAEYQDIKFLRESTVDARALIVREEEYCERTSD